MNIVAALLANPLPTSLAVVIGAAAILGYYFFVIPLMEEHRKLKARNQELESKIEELNEGDSEGISEQLEYLEQAINTLKEAMLEGATDRNGKIHEVAELISEFRSNHVTFGKDNENLQHQMENLSASLQKLNEGVQSFVAGAKARDESINRVLVEVTRTMSNINEKQSQILGALLGMGQLQDRNRGIG